MSFFDLSATTLRGEPQPFSAYAGKAVLVVNVASECGYTPQYEGLERLQEAYADRGLVVMGFPCNQFGAQEPGTSDEIERFCSVKFGVTFPLFAKVEVKGPGQSPIYAFLAEGREVPQWNFHKYLVDREGRVIASFPSSVEPGGPELKAALEAALA
ncbi:MAG: glutathione peroxidase [Acidobacteria bacterium]|nr:glutathione peroxidase [Acidobacteriota bacterium]